MGHPVHHRLSLECLKSLVLCRNNGKLLEDHGLGTHNDKMYADSLTRSLTAEHKAIYSLVFSDLINI